MSWLSPFKVFAAFKDYQWIQILVAKKTSEVYKRNFAGKIVSIVKCFCQREYSHRLPKSEIWIY
jgi:hypothetical protein